MLRIIGTYTMVMLSFLSILPFLSFPMMATVSPASLEDVLIQLETLSETLPHELDGDRLVELDAIANWIANRPLDSSVELIFICTHNSRRSHMSQVWAQAAAWHYGLEQVHTYSGGTEATAFNPRAIQALRNLGVGITQTKPGSNPSYAVQLQPSQPSFEAFSKKYSDPSNPSEGFAAIMTCSQADESCPLVYGAGARFAVPYVDPKSTDNTPVEAETYRTRALQIGSEMFYIMKQAASIIQHQ